MKSKLNALLLIILSVFILVMMQTGMVDRVILFIAKRTDVDERIQSAYQRGRMVGRAEASMAQLHRSAIEMAYEVERAMRSMDKALKDGAVEKILQRRERRRRNRRFERLTCRRRHRRAPDLPPRPHGKTSKSFRVDMAQIAWQFR